MEEIKYGLGDTPYCARETSYGLWKIPVLYGAGVISYGVRDIIWCGGRYHGVGQTYGMRGISYGVGVLYGVGGEVSYGVGGRYHVVWGGRYHMVWGGEVSYGVGGRYHMVWGRGIIWCGVGIIWCGGKYGIREIHMLQRI